jgi:hypothetical protein
MKSRKALRLEQPARQAEPSSHNEQAAEAVIVGAGGPSGRTTMSSHNEPVS